MKKLYLAVEQENTFKIISEIENLSIADLDVNRFEINKYSIDVALKIDSFKLEPVVEIKSLLAIEVDGNIRKTIWIRCISNKNIKFKLKEDLELGNCYMLDLKALSIHSSIPEHLPQTVTK